MTIRPWLYSKLTSHAPLTSSVGSRVYQSARMDQPPEIKPFLMYRMNSDTDRMSGDDMVKIRNETLQIFAHDVPGDYMVIDNLLDIIQNLLHGSRDETFQILSCTWLSNSEDFRDVDMGTICRFSRYQVSHKVA